MVCTLAVTGVLAAVFYWLPGFLPGFGVSRANEMQTVSAGDLPAVRMVNAFQFLRFNRPVFLTHAGDGSGRLFVVEQAGRIHVFDNQPEVGRTATFLDIRTKVRSFVRFHDEEGLLALAFHPEYSRNGYFYIYYSASRPRRGVLSRFRVSARDPDRADPDSERVILEIPQPYGNHNGCCLLFGPDEYLYMSLGDGGWANDPHGHGQDLSTLLGTILRIDVNAEQDGPAYTIPLDNPFVNTRGARSEIWAYGLRNVWRMSFDRATGDLWAGDVGQDRLEEIDLIIKGGNYGWSIREGKHPFRRVGVPPRDMVDPVVEYGRWEGLSVTGGYVYRGQRLKRLFGAYVYADYVSGRIWALRYRDGKVTAHREILNQPRNIASFGEGAHGELYLLAFDGRIYVLQEN